MADLDEIDIFSPEERLQYGLAELPQQSDSSMLDYLPSRAQLGWFGSQFAPGAGVVDASGGMPGMPGGMPGMPGGLPGMGSMPGMPGLPGASATKKQGGQASKAKRKKQKAARKKNRRK